jgi:hypothetical protein
VGHLTSTTPSRGASQLSETRIVIDPEPLPLAPLVTDSHGESDLTVAVQGHPSVVVMAVVSAGTVMQTLNTIGATEYWQPPVSPAWVISID